VVLIGLIEVTSSPYYHHHHHHTIIIIIIITTIIIIIADGRAGMAMINTHIAAGNIRSINCNKSRHHDYLSIYHHHNHHHATITAISALSWMLVEFLVTKQPKVIM
jgi:hypothetical protein